MLKPGDAFDRYTIDAVIGQGGMGSVYRAHDTRLDRRVALKVISDESAQREDARGRLVREARSAAALDHPNAVSIFDVGELEGAPYIVMELVSGRTLREVVGDATIPLSTRVGWLADVARALGAAHRRGLVHRDVKPENVMVRDDGVVKVLDFGIARRVTGQVSASGSVDVGAPTQSPAQPTLTREGVKVGTPAYMAPEQIRGDALDGRADQFVWGVLAFELLTGKLPWRGRHDALSLVASILTDDVPALDGVPPAVQSVVRRALSKKPDDRFPSMEDLVRALEGTGKGEVDPKREPPAQADALPEPRAKVGAGARIAAPTAEQASRSTVLQRYSTEEVQEILSRAVEQQEHARADTRLGFDDLLAAAREVGVDGEILRQASRDLRAKQAVAADDGAARDAWLRKKRRRFYRHLGIWAIVNTALLLMSFMGNSPGDTLPVAVFWGIGVAIHALRTFTVHEDDWREEREKEEKKARKERRRAQAIDRALDEGASVLLKTGAALRRRVAAPPPASADRVRVAAMDTGAGTDAAAEEEAAAAERGPGERERM
jgi:serine/threonine-protein kinase